MSETFAELRTKLGAATQGEWQNCALKTGDCGDPYCTGIYIDGVGWQHPPGLKGNERDRQARANAELIVAAVNALPELLKIAEAAEETSAELKKRADSCDELAKKAWQEVQNNPHISGHSSSYTVERVTGKSSAYRHAAQVLDAALFAALSPEGKE